MYLQLVLVIPQPFEANAQINQLDEFEGNGPRVIVTELEIVVCGLGNPLINVPAGADQVYPVASGTTLVETTTVLPTHASTGSEVIVQLEAGGAELIVPIVTPIEEAQELPSVT